MAFRETQSVGDGVQERYTVVVPCFNEVGAIEATLRRLAEVTTGAVPDLVVVDDGSTDGTSELLDRLVTDDGATTVESDPQRNEPWLWCCNQVGSAMC